MPALTPSQVASAIDQLFGPSRNELADGTLTGTYRAEVQTLLHLLGQIPPELIDLPFNEYLEYARCQGNLATSLARWNVGDTSRVQPALGRDPVERIRRLLMQCPNKLPEPESDLPFINDLEVRRGIQSQIDAAWTDYNAKEWIGATVLAGAALEAMLLWAVKHANSNDAKGADKLHLNDLIKKATDALLITADTATQANLAQDARNLIHPGRVARTGVACSRATGLSALAGVYAVARDLGQSLTYPSGEGRLPLIQA